MNTNKIYAEKVACEYAPKSALKVRQLKKLDRKAKQKARIFSYTFGTVMFLISLLGMSLCIKESGFGFSDVMLVGIISTVIGIIGVNINYPIYKRLTECGKKEYAFEIIELASQISEESRLI